MTLTNITLTDIVTETTSYKGFTTGNEYSTDVKVLHNGQYYLEKIYSSPIVSMSPGHEQHQITGDVLTGKFPFHGHKSTSFAILPPVLMLLRHGQLVPQQFTGVPTNGDVFAFFKESTANGPQTVFTQYRSKLFMVDALLLNQTFLTSYFNTAMPLNNHRSKIELFVANYKNRTTLNYTPASSITNVTSDVYVRESVTLTIDSTNSPLLFVDGNVTISGRSGTTGNVTIIATGNITLGAGFGNTGFGNYLLICPGTITNSAPAITGIYTYSGNNIGTFTNVSAATTITGISATSQYIAAKTGRVTKIYDTCQVTVDGSSWINIQEAEASFRMLELDQNTNEDKVLLALSCQFQHQYNVFSDGSDPNSLLEYKKTSDTYTSSQIIYTNGEYVGKTYICMERVAGRLPNTGVATESFDFRNYHHTMAQTYRVSRNSHVFGTSGRYMTIDQNCDVIFSPTDLEINESYESEDAYEERLITVHPTTLLTHNTVYPEGENLGGSDPVIHERTSMYRIASEGNAMGAVFLGGFYKSTYSYAPHGGKVVSIRGEYGLNTHGPLITRDYELINGELRLYNRYPSKSRAILLEVEVKKSAAATEFRKYTNVSENYPIPTNTQYITYADSECVHVKRDTNRREYFYTIPASTAVFRAEGDTPRFYRYEVDGNTGTLYWGATENDLINYQILDISTEQTTEIVRILAIFSSMYTNDNISYTSSANHLGVSRIPYITRKQDSNGVRGELHYPSEKVHYMYDEKFDPLLLRDFEDGKHAELNGYFPNPTGIYERLFHPDNAVATDKHDDIIFLSCNGIEFTPSQERGKLKGNNYINGPFVVKIFNDEHQFINKTVEFIGSQILRSELPFVLGYGYVSEIQRDTFITNTSQSITQIIEGAQTIKLQSVNNVRVIYEVVDGKITITGHELIDQEEPGSVVYIIDGVAQIFPVGPNII